MVHESRGGRYLYAEAIVRGGAVLLPAGNQGEDAAVLQLGQQLQVSGLLQGGDQVYRGDLLSTCQEQVFPVLVSRGQSTRTLNTSPL